MIETTKPKRTCMWRPKIGQRFMAYHLAELGLARHYHRCCPFICTRSCKAYVAAGLFLFDDDWRFEPCARKGKAGT